MRLIRSLAVGAVIFAVATPASAAAILFTGSRTNVDAPGAPADRCGTRATTNVRHDPPTATSAGLSNLGAFVPTLSHCIQLPLSISGPTPFDLGEFIFDFGTGNSLFGSYGGSLSLISPGLFSVTQTHIVAGGTGFFAGAAGSFDSSGTLSFLSGRPTVEQSFSGELSIAAVPEPSTWAMMLLGLASGSVLWRRRRLAAS